MSSRLRRSALAGGVFSRARGGRGRAWLAVLVFGFVLASAGRAAAQQPPAQPWKPGPGSALRVRVLTFGPGDHPFFKFGHNAIWIEDTSVPPISGYHNRVYNYGTFAFDSWKVIPKFFLGRFQYWLSVVGGPTPEGLQIDGWRTSLASYAGANRSVSFQELDLAHDERELLRDLLEENLKGDNIYYKYNYYGDNCSTRVRDVLDKATDADILAAYREDHGRVPELLAMPMCAEADKHGENCASGRLRAAVEGEGSMTYRAHTLRLTHDLAVEYVVLDVMLGPLVDRPITLWEETFLPEKLADLLRQTKLVGLEGKERPLVRVERTEFAAKRPAALTQAPDWVSSYLVIGVLFGGVLALAGAYGSGRMRARGRVAAGVAPPALAGSERAARIGGSIVLALFAGLLGLLSVIMVLIWMFTDHAVGYRNGNILQFAPWLVSMPFFSVGLAKGRLKTTRKVYTLLVAALGACALGVVVKIIPGLGQDNFRIMAFAIPLWGGAFIGVRQLLRAAEARAVVVANTRTAGASTQRDAEEARDVPAGVPDEPSPVAPADETAVNDARLDEGAPEDGVGGDGPRDEPKRASGGGKKRKKKRAPATSAKAENE